MNSVEDKIQLERSFTDVISDYHQLTKPGITLTVSASMLVGFVLGSGSTINFMLMLHAFIGTYMIAAGTGAYNQFMERRLDGLMKRTAKRPLPDKRINAASGMFFSLILIFSGLLYLFVLVHPLAGAVSFATTFIYLIAYTPMKQVSAFNIVIGAVPGALPPVGGWAAASGSLDNPGIWLLFGIVFFWQVPHVMAIAWSLKEDYFGAGFKMVPKNDESGIKTSVWALICTLCLYPVTIAMYVMGLSGMIFLILSLILATGFLFYSIKFLRERTKENSRKLMFASIAYLPLVWVAVFIDRLI
ncbi:MAG: heme o synthase [Balneola sp.]